MIDETDLRRRLSRLAEGTAPPPRGGLAGTVAARARVQRRQRIGLATVVAAVAAVVVAVPAVLSGGSSPNRPAAPAPAAPTADVLAGPTRGSLAGDAEFVEGVRQLSWAQPGMPGDLPDPDVSARRVVWAGDVAGGRWALVAGPNTARPTGAAAEPERQTDLGALSDVAAIWFVGPPGARPDQMVAGSVPRGVDVQRPLARADPSTGALVVLTAPGDAVQVSLRPEVAADARVSRAWEAVAAPEGVAVLTLPVAPAESSLSAVAYRVTRDGAEVSTSGVETGTLLAPTEETSGVAVDWLRGAPTSPEEVGAVDTQARLMLSTLGLTRQQVRFSVVWSGEVPAPAGPARVVLLAATLPSGAVYAEASLRSGVPGGGSAGTVCGTQLRPAGPPLAEQTFVLACDGIDFTEDSEVVPSLVVIGPPAAASAQLVDGTGAVLAEEPLRDGALVVDRPEALATVTTVAADGTPLEYQKPMGYVLWGEVGLDD